MAIQNIYHGGPFFNSGATFATALLADNYFDEQPDHFIDSNNSNASVVFFGHGITYTGSGSSGVVTGFIVYDVAPGSISTATPLLVATGYSIGVDFLNDDLTDYFHGNPQPLLNELNVGTTYNGSHDDDVIVDVTSKAAHLNGYEGNDHLFGRTGNDTLSGGVGGDHFAFNTAPNSTSNVDHITDFAVPADTIDLENLVFTTVGAAGVLLAAKFFKGVHTHDPNDRIIYNPATGAVLYDSNGSAAGHEIRFAVLAHNLALTHADFLVI